MHAFIYLGKIITIRNSEMRSIDIGIVVSVFLKEHDSFLYLLKQHI